MFFPDFDLALYVGTALFVAWVALFGGLIVLWAWSKLGAPLWHRLSNSRAVGQQQRRRSEFFSVVPKASNAGQPRLVALTGAPRDSAQPLQRKSIGTVLPSSMFRVVAATTSAAATAPVAPQITSSIEPVDNARRPGVGGRWKAYNRVVSTSIMRQVAQ